MGEYSLVMPLMVKAKWVPGGKFTSTVEVGVGTWGSVGMRGCVVIISRLG